MIFRVFPGLLLFAALGAPAAQLQPATAAKIDEIAAKALTDSGAPSVSIAVVQGGKLVLEKAYGNARLDPPAAAAPGMRYSIGSVSKQFLAAAVLLLSQDGKLSLDDRVSKYLPGLTRANEVTIRELLSHTSGYQDYYPQDYVPPFMRKPVTAAGILDTWAKKPLDFDPGTRWQYSNTNFVVAGQIVERVAGMPFFAFLEKRVLQPLGMKSAIDLDEHQLTEGDATGYTRFALGPPRPVQPEAPGWVYAAGELAMTAHDLALWDISLMEHRLLNSASFDAMTTPARLRNGAPTTYGLGIGVANDEGRLRLSHGGAVSGFVSSNSIWPEQGAALVVFANMDGANATGGMVSGVSQLLLANAEDANAAAALKKAREIFDGLREGRIDRELFSANGASYFTQQALSDSAESLKGLGAVETFRQTGASLRGGMTVRSFQIRFKEKSLRLVTLTLADGKLEQYLVQ